MVPSWAPLVELSGPWCWLLLFLWFSGQVHPPALWWPPWACFATSGISVPRKQRHPGSLASLQGILHHLGPMAMLQYTVFGICCFILAHICRVLHCFMQPIRYYTRLFFSCSSKRFSQWEAKHETGRREGSELGYLFPCPVPYNIISGAFSTWPPPSRFQHPLPPLVPLGLRAASSDLLVLCYFSMQVILKECAGPAKSEWSSRDRRADPRPTESGSQGMGPSSLCFNKPFR